MGTDMTFWWPKKKQGQSPPNATGPRAETSAKSAIQQPAVTRKPKLVLFIHGWVGAADETTWAKFPDLVRADPELSKQYDVELFGYATAATRAGKSTPVPECAQYLRTRIEHEWKDYGEIAVIAHSQGGLVTRRYIANQLRDRQLQRISRVLFFATPHMGALGAKLGGALLGASAETKGLAYDSEMLQALFIDEAATDADLAVQTKFVVAADDAIVGRTSAWGMHGPGAFVLVPGEGHRSIIKPTTADHVSFVIAREFLLDANASGSVSATAIHEQPLLRTKQWQQTPKDREKNRFLFWNRDVPFFGRDKEEKTLAAFLGDAHRPFSWMLLTGSGGVGKSRLALELILAQQTGWWYAGFLDGFKTEDYWKLWQPRLPTLLVIDYAARTPDKVALVLKGLAERQPPHLLRRPVRVLLIERDADDPRLERSFEVSPLLSGETTRAADLTLPPIDNVWPIFEHVLTRTGSRTAPGILDNKAARLAALDAIDPQRRPLFAFLVADALARGRGMRNWDRTALLDDVIKRERREFWLPAADSVGLGLEIKKEERALALATMVNGLPIQSLHTADDEVLPGWKHDRHAPLFRAMSGRPADQVIAPLEPDIIGEFFVLQLLAAESAARARGGATFAEVLVAQSWREYPFSTAQFVDRCGQDFSDLAALSHVIHVKPNTALGLYLWSFVAAKLTAYLGSNESTRARAFELYDELKALAAAHPTEERIREAQARAATTLTYESNESTRARALELYNELKALAAAHPTEERIREYQAKAALNLTDDLGSNESTRARALEFYDELKALAAAHPTEKEIRLEQARATFNMTTYLGGNESTRARALELYNELKALAAAYPTEKEIRFEQAKAAVNLTAYLGCDESTLARAFELYDELKALAAAHPTEEKIREAQARAALNLTDGLGRTPRTVLEQIRAMPHT
jgi:hypothetical protein